MNTCCGCRQRKYLLTSGCGPVNPQFTPSATRRHGAPRSLWPAAAVRVAAGVCTSSSIEQAWVARLLHRLKQARRDGPLPHLLYYGYTSMTAPSRSPLAVLTTEQARRDGPLLRFLQSQEQVGVESNLHECL